MATRRVAAHIRTKRLSARAAPTSGAARPTRVTKLVDPRLRLPGEYDRRAREVRASAAARQEDRGAQLEREVVDPTDDRVLAAQCRLQQRPANPDERRTDCERLRGVEPAAHAAGRDDRQPGARGAEHCD